MTLLWDDDNEYDSSLHAMERGILKTMGVDPKSIYQNNEIREEIKVMLDTFIKIYNRAHLFFPVVRKDSVDIRYGDQKWSIDLSSERKEFNNSQFSNIMRCIYEFISSSKRNSDYIDFKILDPKEEIGSIFKKRNYFDDFLTGDLTKLYGGISINHCGEERFLSPPFFSKEEDRLNLRDKLSEIFNYINTKSKIIEDYKYLATGNQGILVTHNHQVWKFSNNYEKEREFLIKVKREKEGKVRKLSDEKKRLENVVELVELVNFDEPGFAMEWEVDLEHAKLYQDYLKLEYVWGKNIYSLIKEKEKLSSDYVFKYSQGILNGLYELRNAGIYHRDLNDRNVMIDEENDKSIIIDLGCATEDPYDICDQTTTYSGNNDLISAAQLFYKMATGDHLFKEGIGATYEDKLNQEINESRKEAYNNREKLEECFEKVRNNVKGDLANLIVNLLDDDLMTQPSLEQVKEARDKSQEYLR